MHGYDVIDPTKVNPELGGEAGLRDLVAALRAAGTGADRRYRAEPHGRRRHGESLVGGRAAARPQQPLCGILRHRLGSRDGKRCSRRSLANRTAIRCAMARSPWRVMATNRRSAISTSDFRSARRIMPKSPRAPRMPSIRRRRRAGGGCIVCSNGSTTGWPGGAARAMRSTGGASSTSMVWSRLRIEDEAVFEATHATLLRLYQEGLIDGVRVDHVDGLADPPGYCRRLRARLDELAARRPANAPKGPAWLVVEKILGAGERLPDDWGVDGTSGYDFMDEVSALLHDAVRRGCIATALGRDQWPSHRLCRARRRRRDAKCWTRAFTAQLDAAVGSLHRIALAAVGDARYHACRDPPRTRGGAHAFSGVSQLRRRTAVSLRLRTPWRVPWGMSATADRAMLALLERWLGEEATPEAAVRFQQLSAPLAAKAVEDTASTVTACCCRATRWVPMCGASARRRPSFTRHAWRGASIFPMRCWPLRRTTTSAARMCERGLRC